MTTDRNPIDVLRARGFVQDVTDEDGLRELFATEQVTYYVGFDPTAPSLHVGNLVGMMAMSWLQRLGHRPIAIAGGATGRIGDPSGRDEERQLLDEEQLQRNLSGIRAQLSHVIDLSSPERGLLLDNHEWLGVISFLDFLRDVGKHFSVNAMISRESVKKRLEEREQGISFTEFSYQLLQAYDFAHLFEAEGCRLQGGGSDQWGNIVAGIDLTRRLQGGEAFGLVWPLVERSDGRKMGKSAEGAVWLDPERTSPYAYYQWFLNLPDADVIRFLKLFTYLELEEIAELESQLERDPAGRLAQRRLAEEATRIMHGDDGVAAARQATDALFGTDRFAGIDDRVLADAFDAAPSADLDRAALVDGIGLLEVMTAVGAARSNGEARRLVDQGGVRLNNVPVDDPTRTLGPDDLAGESTLVLRVGKKRYFLARFR
ncbi:MAG: tyrosine--tRNA ligase [Actinobacteria bacterium]|nr:tyrosine--tRNA ligase [Actinomycetota bacterium]